MLAISINFLKDWVQGIQGPWLYIAVFALAFAETGTLLFFVPGEVTLIIAGITAGLSDGGVNVWIMVAVGCVAAILGDAVGFEIGRRYGDRVKNSKLGHKLGAENWAKAETLIRRRKGLIVLVGRWLGFLRAIMPATAGMSGLNYKKDFLPYDIVGAVSWASICVLGGYKLGDRAETIVKYIGWVAAGAVILGAAAYFGKKWLAGRAAKPTA
jgi:membrane-associated protein